MLHRGEAKDIHGGRALFGLISLSSPIRSRADAKARIAACEYLLCAPL
jgi:hypothetical protein